jgi:uncharacterized membrane protein
LIDINAQTTLAQQQFGCGPSEDNGMVKGPKRHDPEVRSIVFGDIVEALAQGLRDFQAAPRYGLAFAALYTLGGIALVASLSVLKMTYLAYPLAAGFAILGPFVAVGLYQVSRDLETGTPLSCRRLWSIVTNRREVGWMAFVVGFFFVIWMYQVRLLLALFLGNAGSFVSLQEFIQVVFTTTEGFLFLIVGNAIGAALSLILFSITVVSFPLVLDRDVDFVTAMITSVRAVAKNPVPMVVWAGLVVALLVISALPLFLGLLVTLPILGHTTWHLYRRLVVPVAQKREVGAPTER